MPDRRHLVVFRVFGVSTTVTGSSVGQSLCGLESDRVYHSMTPKARRGAETRHKIPEIGPAGVQGR
jgi:hypothetical protein